MVIFYFLTCFASFFTLFQGFQGNPQHENADLHQSRASKHAELIGGLVHNVQRLISHQDQA